MACEKCSCSCEGVRRIWSKPGGGVLGVKAILKKRLVSRPQMALINAFCSIGNSTGICGVIF